MDLTALPLPPDIWAATPGAAQALILTLQERICELEAQLGQTSTNSSRPPSTDPLHAPPRPKTRPTGRKRGGQPGHCGAYRALLPVQQVDEVVTLVPELCSHCGQPFPAIANGRRARVWRHQVVELLPLAVRVIEYQVGLPDGSRGGGDARLPAAPAAPLTAGRLNAYRGPTGHRAAPRAANGAP